MGRHRLKGSSSHHPTNRDHPTQPGSHLTPPTGGDKAHEILVTAERFGDEPSLPRQDYFQRTTTKKKTRRRGEQRLSSEQQAALPCGEGVSDCPQPPPCPAAHKGLFVAVQPRWHLSPRALLCPQFPSGPPACKGFFGNPWLHVPHPGWLLHGLAGLGAHICSVHTHTRCFFLQGVQLRQQKEAERGLGRGFLALPAGAESAAAGHGKARYCRDCSQTPKSQPRSLGERRKHCPAAAHAATAGSPRGHPHATPPAPGIPSPEPGARGENRAGKLLQPLGNSPAEPVGMAMSMAVSVSVPAKPPTPSSPRGSSCAAPAPGDRLSGWACKVEQ